MAQPKFEEKKMDETCPECGAPIIYDEVDIGVGTMRGNPHCDCGWSPDYSKLLKEGQIFYNYPNLLAMMEGRVSGDINEWPMMRRELLSLLSEKEARIKELEKLNTEKEDQLHRIAELGSPLVDSLEKRIKELEEGIKNLKSIVDENDRENYAVNIEVALQQLYDLIKGR